MGRSIKQKEIVLETLQSLKTHPTIKELYEEVKKRDQAIGQATVYRNVMKLHQAGMIRKIPIGEVDHYDADLSSHYHLLCKVCGNIIDIFDESCFNYIRTIKDKQDLNIDSYELILYGTCKHCSGGKIEEV